MDAIDHTYIAVLVTLCLRIYITARYHFLGGGCKQRLHDAFVSFGLVLFV